MTSRGEVKRVVLIRASPLQLTWEVVTQDRDGKETVYTCAGIKLSDALASIGF